MWQQRAYTGMFAAVQALTMVIINLAFEAIGSVPDVEGCGFIAGATSGLVFVYPFASLIVAAFAVRVIVQRFPSGEVAIPRLGAKIGLAGSAFYMITGTILASMRFSNGIPAGLFLLVPLYLALSTLGGAIGAAYAGYKLRNTQLAITGL